MPPNINYAPFLFKGGPTGVWSNVGGTGRAISDPGSIDPAILGGLSSKGWGEGTAGWDPQHGGGTTGGPQDWNTFKSNVYAMNPGVRSTVDVFNQQNPNNPVKYQDSFGGVAGAPNPFPTNPSQPVGTRPATPEEQGLTNQAAGFGLLKKGQDQPIGVQPGSPGTIHPSGAYIAQIGDTPASVAQKNGLDPQQVLDANPHISNLSQFPMAAPIPPPPTTPPPGGTPINTLLPGTNQGSQTTGVPAITPPPNTPPVGNQETLPNLPPTAGGQDFNSAFQQAMQQMLGLAKTNPFEDYAKTIQDLPKASDMLTAARKAYGIDTTGEDYQKLQAAQIQTKRELENLPFDEKAKVQGYAVSADQIAHMTQEDSQKYARILNAQSDLMAQESTKMGLANTAIEQMLSANKQDQAVLMDAMKTKVEGGISQRQAAMDVMKEYVGYVKDQIAYAQPKVIPGFGASLVQRDAQGNWIPVPGVGANATSPNARGINSATGLSPNATATDILGYLSANGINPTRADMPALVNAIQNGATAQDIISGRANVAGQIAGATTRSQLQFNPVTGEPTVFRPTVTGVTSGITTPSGVSTGTKTPISQFVGGAQGAGGQPSTKVSSAGWPKPQTKQQAEVLRDMQAGVTNKQMTSLNTAIGHLLEADEAYKQINAGQFPAVNAITNWFNTARGKSAAKTYESKAMLASSEIAGAYGEGSAGERSALALHGSASESPDQHNKYVQGVASLMTSKIGAVAQNFRNTFGYAPNINLLVSPENQQKLTKLGVNLQSLVPGAVFGNIPGGTSSGIGRWQQLQSKSTSMSNLPNQTIGLGFNPNQSIA